MKLIITLKTSGEFTNAEGGDVLLSYARQLVRERAERVGKIAGPSTITTAWSNGSQERSVIVEALILDKPEIVEESLTDEGVEQGLGALKIRVAGVEVSDGN